MAQPPFEKKTPEKQSGEPAARRNWAGAISRDAGAAATAAFARAGFSDPTLVLRWVEIAGPEVAAIARPVKFSDKDGTLTLLAEPAAALFLGHESRALSGRINAYLGRPAVSRIKFVQGKLSLRSAPPPPPRPAKTMKYSDPSKTYKGPESVKAALMSLARWRAGREPQGG